MRPLRILHVVPYYEHAWAYGGIPRVATTLTHGLVRRGHDVTVCTTDACDATSRVRSPHTRGEGPGRLDVRVLRNLSNTLAYRWQFFTPVGLVRMLRAALPRIDIGHLHACRNLPVAAAARLLAAARVPYIVSPHGTAPLIERRHTAKRVFDATAGRGYLDGAAQVVAVSDAERRQLVGLGVAEARVTLLANPIDEREFAPAPDGDRFRAAHGLGDDPIVLHLSKLTPRKGADSLVRAFAALDRPEARLVIAGSDMDSGLDTDALAANRRALRIGTLAGRDRLDALAAASVVVYPSTDEVFGLVPLEALLAGTPVIVCSDSGAGEIVGTVGGGHIVPAGDDGSLAGAIASILAANGLWRQRARTAGVRVRQRFGTDAVCDRLDALYREVLAHGHTRSRRTA
jgi:glycosyltransferase involved in cell wall biosynthesis